MIIRVIFSIPWYLSVELRGIFTAIIVIVIFIVMQIGKKKIK